MSVGERKQTPFAIEKDIADKYRIRQCSIASVIILFAALLLAGCTPVDDGESAPGAQPRQLLGIASIPNLRDLGGYETRDGKTIKPGLLYCSNQLSGCSPEDMRTLVAIRLRGAYDLRRTEGRESRPEKAFVSVSEMDESYWNTA